MNDPLFKTAVRSLVLTANNIITLNDDEVYERVQPQLQSLANAFTGLHNHLAQLETYYTNFGFEFGQQTVENDILDYARLLKQHEDALDEIMGYHLSGGLNDEWGRDKAAHLKELLLSIVSTCYTICQIL